MSTVTEREALLSEAEAWRGVARRIGEGGTGKRGLCSEVDRMSIDGEIGRDVYFAMCNRVEAYNQPYEKERCYLGFGGPYFYPPGEDWDARLLCALWLACEAEDEVASGAA